MNKLATFLRDIPMSTRGRKTTVKAVYKAFDKEFGFDLNAALPAVILADWNENTPEALLNSGGLFADVMATYLETQGMNV